MNPTLRSVLLVRHARSTANADPAVYKLTPDHVIPLAEPAADPAALLAAAAVSELRLDPTDLCSWCSTYLRCQQTERIVLDSAFGSVAERVRRRGSFLLREQEFGDWDTLDEAQIAASDPVRFARRKLLSDNFGRFYFRYPGGESRADVTQRMGIFINKMQRSRYPHHIVFLHGVTQRAFRMIWFDRSPDWFEEEPNPANASVVLIERDARGRWADRPLSARANREPTPGP